MALDYRKCAEQIVSHIGGRENIVQAAHCATRLRLVIKDNGKVDKKALENVDGVKGMFENNGQLQLIIGTGTVNKVYAEFLSVTGMTEATKDDVKAAAAAGQPIWKRILKAIGDVFVPILPAIVASGLMMGFVEAMGKVYPEFASTSWYDFLDMVANTAFAYLPVIVAISAARVFGGNMFLGAVIGLAMIHANLVNAWVVGTLAEIPKWDFNIFNFIVSVNKVGYQGHVIPVIIAVWLMCAIEKWLHKHTPEMIDLFVVPFTTVLVTTFLTFTIIGPIFSQLETWVLEGAKILVKNPIGSGVMGAIYPWTVVMGLHHMYNVIEAGMLSVEGGLNTWMPIASAANFAQFGACLAVGFKARNNRTKVVAIPSSLSAALGITEPAIFGINLRFFKPIIAGMIGGTIGAIYGAFSGIGAAAYGVTGIPGYLTIQQPVQYTILLAISGGIAFVLSWILWKEEEPEAAEAAPAPAVEEIPEKFVEFGTVISSSGGEIAQCTEGKIIPYTEIPDPTFAAGTLGQGVGIQPEDEYVYAPIDGEISSVAESKHAIGISGENDMEVLIHVGVDTVEMKGDGFEDFVKEGDKVKKGQKIMKFDREKIKAAGHPDTVVLLLTNSDDYQDVKFGANV
ncbi:MAG: PTS glucose transporter subunit IIA [Synergistaceae bacterium]|nr:PTS glucose transporter subunit IIA [Synergistaceae bacterium]MBQ7069460.1 PTS glucose transporter subunit IIA [Synergistaceae bacterium]MBR0080539.1 PTS glucose transporter subunit IIA [Synergistaceae bacterium]MBR0232426.1 PTS glucose transporter subunit IIA [Synergistaceae bacterium]MBR0253361.1 PTS glucose transporter subunit IIA [Synergistaceae bacterium]